MRFLFKLILAFLVFAPSVQAEYFFWQDPALKLSITYPDGWVKRHNQKPGDVVTIWAPDPSSLTRCTIQTYQDRRFLILPNRLDGNVQHIAYSREFWDRYLGVYDNVKNLSVQNDTGLGRGFGSIAEAYYTDPMSKGLRRGLLYAAHYGDRVYVLDCSSAATQYSQWHDQFVDIAKSVQFKKVQQELPFGHYRNFIAESGPKILGANDQKPYRY